MEKLFYFFVLIFLMSGCGNTGSDTESSDGSVIDEQEITEDTGSAFSSTDIDDTAIAPEAVVPQGFTRYCNERFGFCFNYPSEFKKSGTTDSYDGQRFVSADGKAEINAYGQFSVGMSLSDLLEDHKKNKALNIGKHYLGNNELIINGNKGKRIYYERTVSRNDRLITFISEYDSSSAQNHWPSIEVAAQSLAADPEI